MSQATFGALYEYSTSLPSAVYDGKMWKAERLESLPGQRLRRTGNWFLRWFTPHEDPNKCAIESRAILIA